MNTQAPPTATQLLSSDQAIQFLQRQLEEPAEKLRYCDPEADVWDRVTLAVVERSFGRRSRNANHFACSLSVAGESPVKKQKRYTEDVMAKKGMLRAFIKELQIPLSSKPEVNIRQGGVFFSGQTFDALAAATEILNSAKSHLLIIDAYIGPETLSLLPTTGIEIEILTKSVSPKMKTLCGAYKSQYSSLQVRSCSSFHDRFVVVDKSALYHFGASIKDLGNKTFMFSLIAEPGIVTSFHKNIEAEWTKACREI